MTKDKWITVGLVQQHCTADRTWNLAESARGIREAAGRGAKLVLLQELHTGLYFCQTEDTKTFDLAEPVPGPTTRELGVLANELGIVIVASVFEKRASGIYHNTAAVLEQDGTLVGLYRKMHIPDDPGYSEKFYFTPGDLGFHPIKTSVGTLGVLVCWDQWYPEAARLMTLAGAEFLLFPTAIGWSDEDDEAEQTRQRDAWIIIQRSHAIANGLPVLTCNRVGKEQDPTGRGGGIDFWGSSFICGPQGEILAQAGVDQQTVLTTELNMTRSEAVRRVWPYLRDRRIDAYADLLKRFRD